MAKRRNKYNNKKREYKGIKFDSIKELRRYKVLELLVLAKEIEALEVQPVFIIMEAFKFEGVNYPKVSYRSDFRYTKNGITIIEDVKSKITAKEPLYRAKMKQFVKRYIVPSEGKVKFFELN
tara:strand:+ start:382 stop:747 length:366 start_codon:yes stop_codon:yes gene_type:complete